MFQENLFHQTENLSVHYIAGTRIVIVRALSRFIPEDEFRLVFSKVEELVKKENTEKIIFDKSKLKVFHQASMTWYHVEWKPKMKILGVKKHIKILPNDKLFAKSVEIGKSVIARENPRFQFHDYNIQYCATIDEAILR